MKKETTDVLRELTLSGLRGIKEEYTTAAWIDDSHQLSTILKKYRAVTNAAGNGALNVWIDDNGLIRCNVYRWCIIEESKSYRRLISAKKWLDKWIPAIK